MVTSYPTRRTGLGRGLADIVAASADAPAPGQRGPLLGEPEVVPLELVPFPMLLADGEGRVRSANRRWIQTSGMTLDAAVGSGWLAALDDPARAAVEEGLARLRAGASSYQARHRWAHRPGWAVWHLAAQRQAGEVVITIALSEPAAGRPPDPLRAELAALMRSADALADTLDRLLTRLPGIEGRSG